MSVKISSYVWDGCAASGVTGTKLLVIARLADWSNDDGVCWPSVETIARQIGAGVSTVRTAIGELEKAGWLGRKKRRVGNRNASNVYQLNIKKLRDSARSHHPDSDPSDSERSNSDPSDFDPSESGKKPSFHPPESGGDPLVNSKHDPSDKKIICQVPAEPDPETVLTDSAKKILQHLNQTTGSRFQVSKSSMENIRARLADGFSPDELALTVDYLNAKWADDLDMAEYLRPTTIFQPSKFPGYLQSAQKWLEAGRPACVNGKWVTSGGEAVGGGVDETLRDAAYRRFIGSGRPIRSPGELETLVKTEASKAGVRGMRADFSVSRWNSIWKDCTQRLAGGAK